MTSAGYMTVVYCSDILYRRVSIKIQRIYILLNKQLTTLEF